MDARVLKSSETAWSLLLPGCAEVDQAGTLSYFDWPGVFFFVCLLKAKRAMFHG